MAFLEEFAARTSLAYENARQGVKCRRSQELLDAVFHTLPDLICIAGMDGYFRVLNPAWEHTLGWTVDELCAKPYLEFVHPDDRQQTLDEHNRQTQRGEPVVSFENRYRCRDGSYRWLPWNSLPLPDRRILVATPATSPNANKPRRRLPAATRSCNAGPRSWPGPTAIWSSSPIRLARSAGTAADGVQLHESAGRRPRGSPGRDRGPPPALRPPRRGPHAATGQ